MKSRFPLLSAFLLAFSMSFAHGQVYRNISNARFNTVSNGPLQAEVVDVADPNDWKTVNKAVATRLIAARKSREATLLRELQFLRKKGLQKKDLSPGIPDIVVLRQNGRLAVPKLSGRTRAGDITFVFPLSTAGGDGGWTQAQQTELVGIVSVVKPELKNVYGDPSWSGTVTVLNGDNQTPVLSDRNGVWGGAINISTNTITFAQFNAFESRALNLAQMMALAFRGPASISYDAWERGMARAAAMITVNNVAPLLNITPDVFLRAIDVMGYEASSRYDLLNQPPLGNDRFFPASKVNDPINQASLAGMLFPRLQMSSSAWLKVNTEVGSFFKNFNTAYYAALVINPNLKNDVPGLKAIAASVAPNVEGLTFPDWYQRQFALDTSVSVGDKLYAWSFASRPTLSTDDDFSIGVVLVYYRTVIDASGVMNENDLSGTCFPIYWDYTFGNRLFLASQYERVDISAGLGTVAPTFFNTIGGDPTQNGMMRIAMEFPLNASTVRLYVAPRSMGKEPAPNNFWGTVVGADSGTIQIVTETGVTATADVNQGAFGKPIDANAFSRPNRATLTFTDSGGHSVTRKVNVGYNELIPIFYVDDSVDSVAHTLPAGPAMISFPIKPLKGKAAEALLDPTTGNPIFNDNNLLLAQWRQSISGDDKYLKYPSLDPLTPGLGYWSNLAADTPVKIVGRATSRDVDISAGLLHGWNQIGTPYEVPIDINNLQFQYLADNVPVDLPTAVARKWIVSQSIINVGDVVVWDYNPNTGYIQATTLQPWHGYWIQVLVSEGLTITYPNPSQAGRAARISKPNTRRSTTTNPSGWSLQLAVHGANGAGGIAYVGQSNEAAQGYDSRLDIRRPPDFTRAAPIVSLSHSDWGASSGEFYSEVHHTGSKDPWEVTVTVPDPQKTYTLTWSNLNGVPRNTRLILVDTATGRRQYLNASSGYSFTPGNTPTRKFQIIPEDRSRGGLRIGNVVTRQTRAAGGTSVQIGFDLSMGADVTAEIHSGSGLVIRRLGASRAATAGTNQLLWDARDDRAAAVPSGAYILQITARTPEGDMAKVIQPVMVLR